MAKTRHDWRTPAVALRSGVPLFWCSRCGAFSPIARDDVCDAPSTLWLYPIKEERGTESEIKPLTADEIVHRLLKAL